MKQKQQETPVHEKKETVASEVSDSPLEQKVEKKKKKEITWKRFLVELIISLILGGIIFRIKTTLVLEPIIIMALYALLGLLLIQLLSFGIHLLIALKPIALFKKKPKLFVPVGAVLLIFIIGGLLYTSYVQKKATAKELREIQETLATAEYFRSLGDDLYDYPKSIPKDWTLPRVHIALLQSHDALDANTTARSSKNLVPYRTAITTWSADLSEQSAIEKSWKTRTKETPKFVLVLSEAQLDSYIYEADKQVLSLREFSDWAIYNSDKDALRFIAARVFVQLNWLENLEFSKNASNFSFDTAHATSDRATRECKKYASCKNLSQTTASVRRIWQMLVANIVGEKSSESPIDVWNALQKNVSDSEYSLAMIELQEKEDSKKSSPTLDAFTAECIEKGGKVKKFGGTKRNLPTIENGYTCWYEESDKCWDFLTYSGNRYMGGMQGCPAKNLVETEVHIDPKRIFVYVTHPVESITFARSYLGLAQGSYDGSYDLTFSNSACTGVPQTAKFDVNDSIARTLKEFATIEVTNNRIQQLQNATVEVDGKLEKVIIVAEGSNSGSITFHLQFSSSNDGNIVNGEVLLHASTTGVNMNCTTTVDGKKSSLTK